MNDNLKLIDECSLGELKSQIDDLIFYFTGMSKEERNEPATQEDLAIVALAVRDLIQILTRDKE